MGDLAVGARSGRDEPEKGRGPLAYPPTAPGGAPAEGVTENAAVRSDAPHAAGAGSAENAEDDSVDDDSVDGGGPPQPRKQRSFWKELPLLIGIALLLALLIKTFLVQAFSIPSESMMNTLQRDDRVLVDKLTPWFGSEPERGEVVVFEDPGGWLDEPAPEQNPLQRFLSFVGLMPPPDKQNLIKRVIGVGGDTVECKKGGKVHVNGKALEETSYLYPGSTPCDDEPFGPVEVPEGRIWLMGDNRQNSLDSRYHRELPGGGTVANEKVVGRAIVVAWPFDRWSALPVPDTFDQPGLSAAAAAAVGPGSLGLAGALPLVLWRRRRVLAREAAAAGS
ncbi:signal peptidase I [Streptomyces somaliensis]|nr:signal peptidase I [Streptomyces somaliensis]MCP9944439.1 signal peptidase I [Streptomyces somaliensis]MCP9962333.1 signal peptidase I [Streptomyces somaliensis]MCP9975155.1 signal peptidase I [Streptomyces somaliensis]